MPRAQQAEAIGHVGERLAVGVRHPLRQHVADGEGQGAAVPQQGQAIDPRQRLSL